MPGNTRCGGSLFGTVACRIAVIAKADEGLIFAVRSLIHSVTKLKKPPKSSWTSTTEAGILVRVLPQCVCGNAVNEQKNVT